MPFQNRSENIKKIATTLYNNKIALKTKQSTMVSCIPLCQCMGIGKTRITKDFLEILRSSGYNNKIRKEEMKFFDDSILIYINFEKFQGAIINDLSFFKSIWIFMLGNILDMLDNSFCEDKLYDLVLKYISTVYSFLKILKNLFIAESKTETQFFLKKLKRGETNEKEINNDQKNSRLCSK